MGFYENMKNASTVRTENGALGYETSGKALLDLNFAAASLRGASNQEILSKFKAAYRENRKLALRWAFFARDIKGGLGERNLFRVILNYVVTETMCSTYTELFSLIEKYGRYDDFINLIDNDGVNASAIVKVLSNKLGKDIMLAKCGRPCSLLAKWMPSINTSSAATKARARKIAKEIGISHAEYRKMLKFLRDYLNVVEGQISRNKWDKVDYEGVPSYANLKYNAAFLRHDEDRRSAYLTSLSRGEAKINASTLFTYDIVSKYSGSGWYREIKAYDPTLEALWKALPSNEIANTLVVADGSGSMTIHIGNSNVTALDVARSMAIYFAEHNKGEFRNKYITFSERPRFVEFCEGDSLRTKLIEAARHTEVANTDIAKVFKLVLDAAIQNHVPQSEMPGRILIISDMEFDSGADYDEVLFESIKKKFAKAGYKLPKLIFWNVNSRTGVVPLRENDKGVALLSGFSTTIVDMVMSDKTDPYEILVEKLEAYKDVDVLLNPPMF